MPAPPMPPMGGNFSGGSLPGVGDLLSQSWEVFKERLGLIIGIPALSYLILFILSIISIYFFKVTVGTLNVTGLLDIKGWNSVIAIVVLFFIVGLFVPVIIIFLQQVALLHVIVNRNKRISLLGSYRFAFSKILSYWWLTILLSIITIGGFSLFFIPGVIFTIWFSLAVFILIGEDVRGMTAILKSREYIRGMWWPVFGRFLVLFLIICGIAFVAAMIAFFAVWLLVFIIAVFFKSPSLAQSLKDVFSFIFALPFQFFVMPFSLIYGFLIYERLKLFKGSFEFKPSAGQKAGFIAVGIFGWLIPIIMFSFMVAALLSSFSGSRGFLKNLQSNLQVNQGSSLDWGDNVVPNINSYQGINNQNTNSSLFQDTDKDGLSDSIEKSLGTNPNIADTDFDGLSDGDEVNIWKTKPTNPDTDGDGFRDGDEVKGGYNPLGNGKTENN